MGRRDHRAPRQSAWQRALCGHDHELGRRLQPLERFRSDALAIRRHPRSLGQFHLPARSAIGRSVERFAQTFCAARRRERRSLLGRPHRTEAPDLRNRNGSRGNGGLRRRCRTAPPESGQSIFARAPDRADQLCGTLNGDPWSRQGASGLRQNVRRDGTSGAGRFAGPSTAALARRPAHLDGARAGVPRNLRCGRGRDRSRNRPREIPGARQFASQSRGVTHETEWLDRYRDRPRCSACASA